MIFDYNKFKKEVYKEFSKKLSEEEVDKILTLEEGYNKDDPISTGKWLRLSKIHFSGIKRDGSKIEYIRDLTDGVNLWVADNLKGKSSVFKIMKLCLTGKDSLKADVKQWLKRAYLEFAIGENTYTVYLNVESVRANGALYSLKIDDIIGKHVDNVHVLFEAKSYAEFETEIQAFFFKQFSFYSLKWTQKSPKKTEVGLLEPGTSWRTYYKSIYLESKDTDKLTYGGQNELIFQMLLGLGLTYPINRLKIKKEKLEFELATLKGPGAARERVEDEDNRTALTNALKEVTEEIEQLQSSQHQTFQLQELSHRYATASENWQNTRQHIHEYEALIDQYTRELTAEKWAKGVIGEDIQQYNDNILRLKRHNYRLREYIDLGIFFSNLDIKVCPHCSHPVEETRKIYEKNTHHCRLCDHIVEERAVDKTSYELKIQTNLNEIERYTQQITLLESKIEEHAVVCERKERDINEFRQKIQQLEAERRQIEIELRRLEASLRNAQAQGRSSESRLKELFEKRGELRYRIKELENNPEKDKLKDTMAQYETKIEVLEFAIRKLNEKRRARSEDILRRLRQLIHSKLYDLGLDNVSKVIIHPSFKLSYVQNTLEVSFDSASEGEQQRVKLALYLSLIQLDIESNVGRHPRLLIIDTPAKEEADKHYLDGLTKALRTIDESLGDKLQIFVGTACRELSDVAKPKKAQIMPPGEYVF